MPQDIHRRCASIVLVRHSGEVLLVHKPRKKDAWQLPQGGIEEGESVEEAALRELKEEAGINAQAVGKSDTVYEYHFPASYRRFRPDNVCGQRVEFVFAAPVSSTVEVSVDNNEIDGFVWVMAEDVGQYIKRKEYRDIVVGLIREQLSR